MEGHENVAATGIESQQSRKQRATYSSPVAEEAYSILHPFLDGQWSAFAYPDKSNAASCGIFLGIERIDHGHAELRGKVRGAHYRSLTKSGFEVEPSSPLFLPTFLFPVLACLVSLRLKNPRNAVILLSNLPP